MYIYYGPQLPGGAQLQAGGGTDITAVVLTVTPSLPAARLDQDITAAVLTVTPSQPAARVDQDLTAQVLTVTPTQPAARVDHDVLAIVLSVTPTQPAATIQADQSITAIVLTVTPSLPSATLNTDLTAVVLTVTPSYPQAQIDHSIIAAVLTVTPAYPQARLDTDITAAVLTVTPSLPASSIRHHTTVRPTSDVALDGWTDELDGTTDIYLSIDETSANDTDYVQSPESPTSDVYEFHLGNPTDPACSGGHNITYRYKKESAGDTLSLVVRLFEGAVEIASWTHSNISDTITEATQVLTPTQADAISDYTDLRVKLEANQV